jgi:RimJ/RimL family protein N-acetyltransferase
LQFIFLGKIFMVFNDEKNVIRTGRLTLIASTAEHHTAELESKAALGELLDVEIPGSWPPGEYDCNAIEFFRKQLLTDPEKLGWYSWYAILTGNEIQPDIAIGAGGYTGTANSEGTIEIGYSILPEYRYKGYATELVSALVKRALNYGEVKRIIAHTTEENSASIKVLGKCGFILNGPGPEKGFLQYIYLQE